MVQDAGPAQRTVQRVRTRAPGPGRIIRAGERDAQAAAKASPASWAMQGMRGIILDGEGMRTALSTCLALACFAVLFTLLTVVRFNAREAKVSET